MKILKDKILILVWLTILIFSLYCVFLVYLPGNLPYYCYGGYYFFLGIFIILSLFKIYKLILK